jgi:SAM-dependent methyltransferase
LNKGLSSQPGGVYSQAFQGGDAVARYFRKLENRIDVLRDRQEAEILGRRLSGRLFDCTIGVGRFIGRLPQVTSYAGMDLSAEFVDFVRGRYPGMLAQVGDLTRGIEQPDGSYDSVMCLRSLSAIGQVERILAEMVRIVRPGGIVALDYGRAERRRFAMRGAAVRIDAEDLDAAIGKCNVEIVERIRVDGILARLKMRLRVFRFLTGRHGGWVPDSLLMLAERALAPLLWQREIVLLRKR